MKTILQIKKLFIIPLLFLVGNVWGQITYSGSPTTVTGASCPPATPNEIGTCGTFVGGTIKAYVVISGTSATFYLIKCATSPNNVFGTGISGSAGSYVLKTVDICGTNVTSGGVTNGSTVVPITVSLTHTGVQNYRITFLSSNGTRYYTNNIAITGTQLLPNLVCGTGTVTPTSPIQGQNASFSYSISNTGTGNYNGTLTMWWRSATTGSSLGTQISSLNAGASNTFTHNSTPLNSAPGNYVLSIEKADGTVICSKNVTVLATQPNLVCGTGTVTPTSPIQGQNASFSYSISNTGTGNYNGTLTMWWRSATTGSSLGTQISSLNAGASNTFTHNSTPLNSAPGNYVLNIEKADGTVICSKNVTVVSAPSCITWSGTPPTGEKLTAANYLCTNDIIVNTQNGTDNATNGIPRELLAKITYLGIYKGSTPNSPAVNFPVPFTDMQGSSTQYMDAIKTLAYLQYTDDTTPFDRDLINFNPDDLIERKYVIKALAEAFNIAKSIATPSPFSDVPTTHPMYGYIKRFHELGFVTGNQVYTSECTTGTCFHPDANITREDVFVVLYRILTATNFTRPTSTQLGNLSNYFVPGNNRMATMGKVPGIDQANFNHYQKTSFSIPGRGIGLDFTHTYNSFLTELPKGYFEEDHENVSSQKFTPLGIGWTHTYNIYAQKIAGYSTGNEPEKIMIYYPDGSINTFNYATGVADGVGIYDVMTRTPISGGERITITTKGQTKYVFQNYNNGKFYFIQSIKDRNNNGVKINWQNFVTNKYRISSVQEEFNDNSLGRSLNFTYMNSISGYLQQVTDNSIGRNIQFVVAPATKSLTSYRDPKGQLTSYTYDDANHFNKSNLLTEILLPKENKIRNTYVNRKLTASQTFNQNNVATSTTNVNWTPNYSSGQQYNSSSTITDPQGKNTNYTHNTLGNPTQVVAPTGTTTFNNYATGNNANLPTSLTVNGQSSSINYDTRGNVLNITKNGITNTFTYTSLNDVQTHTDGRNFTSTYSYDGVGNLSSVQRPSGGGTTTILRNSFGQVQSVTNPSGIITQFGFNTNGLTNQITMPLGITTSSNYDNASRLLSTTDANGKTNSFQYDANDNLTQSTDANTQIVQHTYDANDNHLTIKNPKNETQTNNYNFDDDMLASETFGSHTKSYTYNTDGSLATHTRGNGTFTYSYNSTTGRLTSDGHTSYAYDTRGNITSITNSNGTLTLNYDNNDRMTSYSDYFNNTVSYIYDNNNNVTRITYPGNKQVNYVYDAVNRCTSVTDWNNKVTTYTYLTDDRVSKITLPNGTFTDYTYESAGRMTSTINKKANGTVIILICFNNYDYVYLSNNFRCYELSSKFNRSRVS
jgi:YD repeat-containing protein